MVLTVLGVVAEIELGFIRDRQRAGIEAAKAKGIYKGRPATFDRARIVALRKQGMGPLRSPRPSGANEGTSTRRSRLPDCPRLVGSRMDRDPRALVCSGTAKTNPSRYFLADEQNGPPPLPMTVPAPGGPGDTRANSGKLPRWRSALIQNMGPNYCAKFSLTVLVSPF